MAESGLDVQPYSTKMTQKSNISSTSGSYHVGMYITDTQYVGTALTYVSTGLPSILRSSTRCTPSYAHHVVLMPLTRLKYGQLTMKPLSMPRYLARSTRTMSGESLNVSVSLVGLRHQDAYASEIKYRKEYGIIAALNWKLIQARIISRGESFRLLSQNVIHFETGTFNWQDKDVDAMLKAYYTMFVDVLAQKCIGYQPIIID